MNFLVLFLPKYEIRTTVRFYRRPSVTHITKLASRLCSCTTRKKTLLSSTLSCGSAPLKQSPTPVIVKTGRCMSKLTTIFKDSNGFVELHPLALREFLSSVKVKRNSLIYWCHTGLSTHCNVYESTVSHATLRCPSSLVRTRRAYPLKLCLTTLRLIAMSTFNGFVSGNMFVNSPRPPIN